MHIFSKFRISTSNQQETIYQPQSNIQGSCEETTVTHVCVLLYAVNDYRWSENTCEN